MDAELSTDFDQAAITAATRLPPLLDEAHAALFELRRELPWRCHGRDDSSDARSLHGTEADSPSQVRTALSRTSTSRVPTALAGRLRGVSTRRTGTAQAPATAVILHLEDGNSYAVGMTVEEIEAVCRGLLHNAAGRDLAASRAAPDVPGAEYRTGFAAGHEEGELAAMALVVAMISGESATALVDEARSAAVIDAVFPIDLHIEGVPIDGEHGEAA